MAAPRCRRFVPWACLEPATPPGYLTVSACITLPTTVRSIRAGLVELGLNPDDRAAVVGLAAVGATLVGWRAGPLEDWHSEPESRISDPELVRASVAMTRLAREVLTTDSSPFAAVSALFSDLERRLPDGRTLAEIALTSHHARQHAEYARAAVRRWELLAAELGQGVLIDLLACAAAWRARRWWGTPWWPHRVEAFVRSLGDQDRAALLVDHSIVLDVLRAKLLDGPDQMASRLVAACLRAGIGDPSLASEPLVSRRFAAFAELVNPDTPDEEHRRLLVNLRGRGGAT